MENYGIIAAGITTILGVLFKGKFVVLARELEARDKACDEICKEKEQSHDALQSRMEAEIVDLKASLKATQGELKEQINANATLYREVLGTISWLQSIAGLAQNDRRGAGRSGNIG